MLLHDGNDRALDMLFPAFVDSIRQEFKSYVAMVFLVREESQNWLILVQEQTVDKMSSNLKRVWHGIS